MLSTQKKWPGINVADSDRQIIKRIQEADGVLKSIQAKDLLLIAASIAVKQDLPKIAVSANEPLDKGIVNPGLMIKHEYSEFRQYIALIFYVTQGQKQLSNMSDLALMVKNFVDYARRGLRFLEQDYLVKKDGSEDLLASLAQMLSKH